MKFARKTFCMILLFIAANSSAQVSSGWPLFNKFQSARPKALTNTLYSPGDILGSIYNPALLAYVEGNELNLLSGTGYSDETYVGLLYAYPKKNGLNIAFGLFNNDYGKIELNWFDNGSLQTRTVSAQNDLLLTMSGGRKISKRLGMGFNMKFAASSIAETATANAVAFDGGISCLLGKKFSCYASARNIGSSTKFANRIEELPSALSVGASFMTYFAGGYLRVAGETQHIDLLKKSIYMPSIAFEIGRWPYSLFAGYTFLLDDAALCAGFGITTKLLDFSYSYTPAQWLDSVHRVVISYRFGNKEDARKDIKAEYDSHSEERRQERLRKEDERRALEKSRNYSEDNLAIQASDKFSDRPVIFAGGLKTAHSLRSGQVNFSFLTTNGGYSISTAFGVSDKVTMTAEGNSSSAMFGVHANITERYVPVGAYLSFGDGIVYGELNSSIKLTTKSQVHLSYGGISDLPITSIGLGLHYFISDSLLFSAGAAKTSIKQYSWRIIDLISKRVSLEYSVVKNLALAIVYDIIPYYDYRVREFSNTSVMLKCYLGATKISPQADGKTARKTVQQYEPVHRYVHEEAPDNISGDPIAVKGDKSGNNSVSGIITDTSGNPIPGVLIHVIKKGRYDTRPSFSAGPGGEFAVEGLSLGIYNLSAAKDGYKGYGMDFTVSESGTESNLNLVMYRADENQETKNSTIEQGIPGTQETTEKSFRSYKQAYESGLVAGKENTSGLIWGISGFGFGIFGIGFSYIMPSQPLNYMVRDFDEDSRTAFTEGYSKGKKNKRANSALYGWLTWILVYAAAGQ